MLVAEDSVLFRPFEELPSLKRTYGPWLLNIGIACILTAILSSIPKLMDFDGFCFHYFVFVLF